MTSEPEQVVISPDSFDVAIFDLDGVITDTARSMPPPGNTSSTSTIDLDDICPVLEVEAVGESEPDCYWNNSLWLRHGPLYCVHCQLPNKPSLL